MSNLPDKGEAAQAVSAQGTSVVNPFVHFTGAELMANLPKPVQQHLPLTSDDFDDDDDPWYVQLCALDAGLDPDETWREVQAQRKRRLALLAIAEVPTAAVAEAVQAQAASPSMPWPPGRAGVIARYLHDTSYLPIPEVAITATLALLAGVCGRAYRTHTGKDLALYIILVAKSGVGKDAIHEGIPKMLNLADDPMVRFCLRAEDFVSGEALHKALLNSPGFLYLQGEFGRKLKRMANPTDSPMQTFRTVLTNTFAKQYLEGKTYSRAEDSIAGVEWPALSFLGETTPTTFLESLTSDMLQDGFLSRFIITTYEGGQPAPNKCRTGTLPEVDLQLWKDLARHAAKYQGQMFVPDAIVAVPDVDAEAMLDKFRADCRERLNATESDGERHVWTRAHLKALKAASLLAVADSYLHPVVTVDHAKWAMDLVERDIAMFLSNQRDGNVGAGDSVRERKLVAIIRDYITKEKLSPSYKVPPAMHKAGLVTRSYLQIRVTNLPAFTDHKLGANKALDDTLFSLSKSGYIMEVKKEAVVEGYNHFGKAYRILGLP